MANAKGQIVNITVMMSKKTTGGWSRWGGGRKGLIKSNVGDSWTCQSCATDHTGQDSPYMFELFPGEYIRICSNCLRIAKIMHAVDFLTLKKMVNRKGMWIDSLYDPKD